MKKKIALSVAVGLASTLASTTAYSSGYAVNLFSGWAAGMANAGHGVQDDPMLSFVNPAAMILNKCHHFAGQLSGVFPYTKFKGRATNLAIPNTIIRGIPFDETGKTRNAAKIAAIPSMGFVWRMHEDLRFSLAVNAPYGLKFHYGNDSVTQFHTKKASMFTVNITPSVAYRIHEMITLGIGFQAQYTKVKLTQNIGYPIGLGVIGGIRLKIDDWNHGWTAGTLLNLTKKWNLGISYRSNLDANLHGRISASIPAFTIPANALGAGLPPVPVPFAAFSDHGKSSAKAFIPHVVTLSTSYSINPCWTVYGSAVWTGWQKTKSLKINSNLTIPANVIPGGPTITPEASVVENIKQHWKNVWFFSAGVDYKINEAFAVRTGLGYDKSPTRTSTRVPALPDSDKWWLGLGGTYTRGKWAVTVMPGMMGSLCFSVPK